MTKEQQRSIWELINQSQELSDDIQDGIDDYEAGIIQPEPLDERVTVKFGGKGIRFQNPDGLADWIVKLQQKGITDL